MAYFDFIKKKQIKDLKQKEKALHLPRIAMLGYGCNKIIQVLGHQANQETKKKKSYLRGSGV